MYVVYALIDPDEIYKVCYIGISQDVYNRFYQHLREENSTTPKAKWLRELRERNRVPYCKVLEEMLTEEEAKERERYWIHFYLELNMPLKNISVPHIPQPPHLYVKPNNYEEIIVEYCDKGMSARAIHKLMKGKGVSYHKIWKVLHARRPGWNNKVSV